MADATTPTLPSELLVLPLRRTVAFPLTLQPLAVNRAVSIESVNRALAADRLILLLLQKNDADDPTPEDVSNVGTFAVIRQMAKGGAAASTSSSKGWRASARMSSRALAPRCAR